MCERKSATSRGVTPLRTSRAQHNAIMCSSGMERLWVEKVRREMFEGWSKARTSVRAEIQRWWQTFSYTCMDWAGNRTETVDGGSVVGDAAMVRRALRAEMSFVCWWLG